MVLIWTLKALACNQNPVFVLIHFKRFLGLICRGFKIFSLSLSHSREESFLLLISSATFYFFTAVQYLSCFILFVCFEKNHLILLWQWWKTWIVSHHREEDKYERKTTAKEKFIAGSEVFFVNHLTLFFSVWMLFACVNCLMTAILTSPASTCHLWTFSEDRFCAAVLVTTTGIVNPNTKIKVSPMLASLQRMFTVQAANDPTDYSGYGTQNSPVVLLRTKGQLWTNTENILPLCSQNFIHK